MYLEIENLSKSFDGKEVVSGLKLSMAQGEILCLLGASGCGKTTTLRMLGGFLRPDGGKIFLDGEDITGLEPERRPVSTVFQSYALFPHMTVLQNVMYGLKFQGLKRKEAAKRAYRYLDIVGLSERGNGAVQELSGGQQQRVALARALAVNPKVLLLDEPLSNLDAKLRIRMRDELKELQKKTGITMIFVTHDQEEAMALADRIAIMDGGRLVQTGTPAQVYQNPANLFVMEFLGTADRIELPDGQILYVRPEEISILGRMKTGEEGETEEDVKDQMIGTGKKSGCVLMGGTISKAEYMGFYSQYFVTAGSNEIMVRDFSHGYQAGEAVWLSVCTEHAFRKKGCPGQ